MDNAVYATATGMINRARALDITGNNIANAQTPGYKQESLVTKTFGEYITYRISDKGKTEIGTTTHGCAADSVYTDTSRGQIVKTGRSLDLVIEGNGFFRIAYENGNTGLTRNGSFHVDQQGYLTTSAGAYVMGTNGRINLGTAESVIVGENGAVSVGGRFVDTLEIITPADPATLEKQAEGIFSDTGGNTGEAARVLQGSLELSNVDLTQEMMAMIEESRAFQTCGQVMKILDSINQKTVNEIGLVR